MNRQKAIQMLKRCEAESYCNHYKQHHCCIGCGQREALDLAIEALQERQSWRTHFASFLSSMKGGNLWL